MQSAMDWAQAKTMAAEGRSQREIAAALSPRAGKEAAKRAEAEFLGRIPAGDRDRPTEILRRLISAAGAP